MASKEQESSEILDKLQVFCSSSGMEAEFEAFAADHVDVFISSLDLNREGVEEHPLEYHAVYRKYLAQFEAKIEAFIDKVPLLLLPLLCIAMYCCILLQVISLMRLAQALLCTLVRYLSCYECLLEELYIRQWQ
jgi:hypothetical protein